MWSCGVVLYVLVCQGMPFSIVKTAINETGEKIEISQDDATFIMQQNIQKGNYSMEPCDRLGLSQEVRDLIQSLLCVDPDQRLTAAEALAHPWFDLFSL